MNEKVEEKFLIIRFFAILTLQILLCKSVSAFFLETSISENMGDFKGRRRILMLQ